ncbi:hypothetical protein [Rhizobium sp. CECT 9324]|uniref:hypothetical protein n=1 Tax=Rhizobium sp. CECT 9324 TaxID=2845820 RepID=UPI001E64752A|nr:hypothetical protein [Rhizobium sp. CECT 9324]
MTAPPGGRPEHETFLGQTDACHSSVLVTDVTGKTSSRSPPSTTVGQRPSLPVTTLVRS